MQLKLIYYVYWTKEVSQLLINPTVLHNFFLLNGYAYIHELVINQEVCDDISVCILNLKCSEMKCVSIKIMLLININLLRRSRAQNIQSEHQVDSRI